jgi:hypothetical protein
LLQIWQFFGGQDFRPATDFCRSRSKTQHIQSNTFMQNHTFVRLGKVEKRVLMFGVTTLKNLVTRPLCRRQGLN